MNPSDKISIIQRSLRCCRYGYLSLIPLIGIVMAILAFQDFGFVRRTCGLAWNPAKARVKLGITLAVIGLIISTLTVCLLIYPPLDRRNSSAGQYDYE